MRFGIALIVAGIAVIIFTALFGFPKAPVVPLQVAYDDVIQTQDVARTHSEDSVYCGSAQSGSDITFINATIEKNPDAGISPLMVVCSTCCDTILGQAR